MPTIRTISPPAVHRRRAAPEDHLCTCGRLREECVREAVRDVWRTRATRA